MRARVIVVAAVSVLVLSGCVPADPNHPESLSAGASSVTWADYTTAFEQLRDCVEAGGVIVTDPVVDPVSNTHYSYAYEFNGQTQSEAMTVISGCEAGEWTRIDMAIQMSGEQHMNADLAQFTATCLEHDGFDVSGDERSVAGFLKATGDSEIDAVNNCVGAGIQELYPQVTTYGVGY